MNMPSSTIHISLDRPADYAKAVGGRISYPDSSAQLRPYGNTLEISFTANDTKSLFSAMNSILRQLTIVDNAMSSAEGTKPQRPGAMKGRNSGKAML